MYSQYHPLALDLLRDYIKAKLSPTLQEDANTEAHSLWQIPGCYITITVARNDLTLVNVVKGEHSTPIYLDWSSLGVKLPLEKITPDVRSAFEACMDAKLFGGDQHKRALQEATSQQQEPKIQKLPQESAPTLSDVPVGSEPRRPQDMPDFEDEYEIKPRATGQSPAIPLVGDRDLNPPGIGRYPAMKPYLDPLSGGEDGGMYPSPDHPMFGGRSGNTSRLGVPPGARFDDPYGESNLDDMGMGLPGNIRRGGQGGPGGPGGPGFDGNSGFGGNSGLGGNFGPGGLGGF